MGVDAALLIDMFVFKVEPVAGGIGVELCNGGNLRGGGPAGRLITIGVWVVAGVVRLDMIPAAVKKLVEFICNANGALEFDAAPIGEIF